MKNLDSNGLGYLWTKLKNKFLTKKQYELDNRFHKHIMIKGREGSSEGRYYLLAKLSKNDSGNSQSFHIESTIGPFHQHLKARVNFILGTRAIDYNHDFDPTKSFSGFYYGDKRAFEYNDFYVTKDSEGYYYVYLADVRTWLGSTELDYGYYFRSSESNTFFDELYTPEVNDYVTEYQGELIMKASDYLINYETEINQIKVRTSVPVGGSIVWYGTEDTIPSDYMREDGRSLNKNDYPLLFSRIGYTYGGEGDNFNIPDSRGRVIVHVEDTNDANMNARGIKYGEKTHKLISNEMPSHNHDVLSGAGGNYQFMASAPEYTPSAGHTRYYLKYHGTTSENNSSGMGLVNISNTGGGQAHNNIQPSLIAFRIIKVREDVSTGDIINLDEKVRQLEAIVNKLNTNLGDLEVEIIEEWDDTNGAHSGGNGTN